MAGMFLIFVLFLLINTFAFAQTEKYSAPVNWERYKVSESSVSIFFPKLPVKISMMASCEERETNIYSAYAEEAVYKLVVHSKSKEKIPKYCPEKVKFGEQTLSKVIREKKQILKDQDETNFIQSEREVTKFTGKTGTNWIFSDLKNKKIYELSISHRNDINPDEKRFVESIDFENEAAGIEIKDGALRTLGDLRVTENLSSGAGYGSGSEKKSDADKEIQAENSESKANNLTITDKEKLQGLVIITKPTPRYTDLARQKETQGTVMLRVTFLANGGIGSITPVTSLPYGLTEQAIVAAYKLTFLPAKRNGVTLNAIAQVQYSFVIY